MQKYSALLFGVFVFLIAASYLGQTHAAVVCTVNGNSQPGQQLPICSLNNGDSAQITLRSGQTRTIVLQDVRADVTANNGTCNFIYKATATLTVDGEQVQLGVALNQPYTVVKGVRLYALNSNIYNGSSCPSHGSPSSRLTLLVSDASVAPFDTSNYHYPIEQLWGLNNHAPRQADAGRYHDGYDIGTPRNITKILAHMNGYIWGFGPVFSGASPENNRVQVSPQGNQWSGLRSNNLHVSSLASGLSNGNTVSRGQWIANSGFDGNWNHLHWQLESALGGNEFPFLRETYYANMVPQAKYAGYIKDWLILGPFSDSSSSRLSSDKIGGETSTEPTSGQSVGGKTWKSHDNLIPGVVNLAEAFSLAPNSAYTGKHEGRFANSVGYAHTYIHSPSSQQVQLWLGYNDGAKVWLNGSLVHEDNANYTYNSDTQDDMVPDQAKVSVTLQSGWNRLLVKVSQDSGDNAGGASTPNSWKFSAKLARDSAGNPVTGITVQANNPGGSLPTPPPPLPTPVPLPPPPPPTPTPLPPPPSSGSGWIPAWPNKQSLDGLNVPISKNPPGGLSSNQIPQFIVLGSDDNWHAGGVNWFVDTLLAGRVNPGGSGNRSTFDGSAALMTFFNMGTTEFGGRDICEAQRAAYVAGHELGNHGYWGLAGEGPRSSAANWLNSWITPTQNHFTGSFTCNTAWTGSRNEPATKLGVPDAHIYGFRTPQDAYNDALFSAIDQSTLIYHSSTRTGHTSQSNSARDLHFPGTLDNGIPYANSQAGTASVPRTPGVWETPQSTPWLPSSIGSGTIGYCDKDWFWAFRNDDADTQRRKITDMLKYNLDEHLAGNRSPLHLCLHSQEWRSNPTRQQILVDFLNYALTKPEVRVVRNIDVIDWMANPVALGGSSSPSPTPPPPSPLPTPVPLPPPPPPAPATFSNGDRVRVTSALNVRNNPSVSGTLLGTKLTGALGTVIGGPQSANGFTWWQINYDSAPDGWSVEDALVKTSTPAPSPTPPTPVPPPSGSVDVTLNVNAQNPVAPLTSYHRGTQLSPWTYVWGEHPNRVPGLIDMLRPLDIGIFRYGGGLWANTMTWSRTGRESDPNPNDSQGRVGRTYTPSTVDDLENFADLLDAEIMMQINLCNMSFDTAQWADMVRYTTEKGYDRFTIWEISNEVELFPANSSVPACLGSGFDHDSGSGPAEYARRFKLYDTALKAVDSRIKTMGPVTSATYRTSWYEALAREMGNALDALSIHWYQLEGSITSGDQFASVESLFSYDRILPYDTSGGCRWPGCPGAISDDLNLVRYRRKNAENWMDYVKSNIENTNTDLITSITEFGVHAANHNHPINSNHVAAIWAADTLARWAYNGLDQIIWYDLDTGGDNARSLIDGVNSGDGTLTPRSLYYTLFMYAQYMGDMFVQSSTTDSEQKVVAWATTDSDDPGKLKIMIVNLTGETSAANLVLQGFSPRSGIAYEMTNPDPLDLSTASRDNPQTVINGVKIPPLNPNNIAGWRTAVNAIPARTVSSISGNSVRYDVPAYSAVALVLSTSGTIPLPLPAPPTPPPTPPAAGAPKFDTTLPVTHIFLDRPTTFQIPGVDLSPADTFAFKLKTQNATSFQTNVQPKDGSTVELDFRSQDLSSLQPGFYTMEMTRGTDNFTLTHSRQLLVTRLGDMSLDGKVDIQDISRFLSRWGSGASSDIEAADFNGPQGVPDGKIDIYDANKLMSNWTG